MIVKAQNMELRLARVREGLSQRGLAEKVRERASIYFSQEDASRLESGWTPPEKIRTVIATILNVEPDSIFSNV